MKTKNFLLLGAAILGMGVVACGDDSGTGGAGSGGDPSTGTTSTTGSPTSTTTTTGGNPTSTSSGNNTGGEGGGTGGDPGEGGAGGEGGSGPPAVPELGAQLERMGRPAINTATIETFVHLEGEALGPTTDVIRSAAEDDYNAAANGSDAARAFIPTQALQLTVLDGLDDECGNQPLFGFGGTAAACPDSVDGEPITCYTTLAAVLNNDALWVNTDYETCAIYLGVEADTAATLGSDQLPANNDCGGRRPVDDVIATTYSVVSGALDGDGPAYFLFDDKISAPEGLHPTEFPYLAAPNEE